MAYKQGRRNLLRFNSLKDQIWAGGERQDGGRVENLVAAAGPLN